MSRLSSTTCADDQESVIGSQRMVKNAEIAVTKYAKPARDSRPEPLRCHRLQTTEYRRFGVRFLMKFIATCGVSWGTYWKILARYASYLGPGTERSTGRSW